MSYNNAWEAFQLLQSTGYNWLMKSIRKKGYPSSNSKVGVGTYKLPEIDKAYRKMKLAPGHRS